MRPITEAQWEHLRYLYGDRTLPQYVAYLGQFHKHPPEVWAARLQEEADD